MLHFASKYISYYLRNRFSPKVGNDTLRPLSQNGVQIIPKFLSTTTIDRLNALIESQGNAFLPQVDGNDNPNLAWRNYNLRSVDPIINEVLDNEFILNAAKYYIGEKAFCSRAMLAQKNTFNREKDGPTEYYHFDDWKHRFKIMIYLDDVTVKNSPFCYLAKSHRFNFWKFYEDYKFYRDFDRSQPPEGGNIDWTAVYRGDVLEQLKNKYQWEEVKATGPRGTAILFDSRGLHRGLPLESGFRRVIILHFKNEKEDGESAKWTKRKEVDLV